MNLTSFEVSSLLEEAGIDLETEFYWNQWPNKKWQLDYIEYEVGVLPDRPLIKAYDFETLFKKLPQKIYSDLSKQVYGFDLDLDTNLFELMFDWLCPRKKLGYYAYVLSNDGYPDRELYHPKDESPLRIFIDECESYADCAAGLLLKLLEQGLITVEEINKPT